MEQKQSLSNKPSGPIAWMAGRSVTANLLMLFLLVGGFFMTGHIKKEVFPDYELDMVNISVTYPGASPEEVERGILLAVEEAVQGIEGIKEMTASAKEGIGTVTIELLTGEDASEIAQEIKDSVDRIASFPDDAEEVQVVVAKRKRYVVSLALYGDQPEKVLREMAEIVRDKLLQDDEITQVELDGVREYEISIEVSQENLRTYGLTLEEIARRVEQASVEIPGGAIKTSKGDVLVRVNERKDYGREFGKIPIISDSSGVKLLLEDIADIHDDFEESDRFATFNGQPAVMIEVYRIGDQTPVSVSDAVHRQLEQINEILPQGLSLIARNDRSDIYKQRLDLMLRNGYLGLGLVFILLAVFLEARLAFWVSLGIPISFLGGLIFLPLFGTSINMVSMFAFIVTLGIVVDDAIIVGENIYSFRQQGMNWQDAAINGAKDITMPVVFSVLTNMVTFMPLFFVPGFMGKIFREIPVVVIVVFSLSLVESLLILPAHVGHQKPLREGSIIAWIVGMQQRFSHGFARFIHNVYGPFLAFSLRWRYVTLSAGVAILIVSYGYVKSGRLGFELFPKIESDYASVTAVLPFGTSVANTTAVQKRLVESAQRVAEANGGDALIDGIYSSVNGNTANIRMYLKPPKLRPLSTAQVTQLWRDDTGIIPGLDSLKFESDAGGPGRGAAMTIELTHRDTDTLETASMELAEKLSFYPNVLDIDDGIDTGKEQIDFKIKPEGISLGLQAADVARQIRSAYYGVTASRQLRGRNEVKVLVRLPRAQRDNEYNLEEMLLRLPDGGEVPLRDVVSIERGRAYTSIERRDGRRIVAVSADVKPRNQAGMVIEALKAEVFPELQTRYPGLTYGFKGRQADTRESVQSLIRGLLIALVIIFAMLAVPMNSYIQPVVIMLAIPFGLVGAVLGHLIMGYSLSVISIFGIVALSGVVVNDSLVLISFANRRLADGATPMEAVHQAALTRFRPIMLTTLTTFGGLAPMIFETSRQARFLIPMAISLGYGICFATIITLVLVPSFYMVIESLRSRIHS